MHSHLSILTSIRKRNQGDMKLILTQSYLEISRKASVKVIFNGGTLTFVSVTTRVRG